MFKYPYTDLESVNLDFILNEIRTLDGAMNDFTALNKIKWSGEWDVSKPYSKWEVVNSGESGYISIGVVPAGVPLTNSAYWQPIANYTALYADCQTRLDDLEQNRFNEKRRNIIVIGDSYATGDQYNTGQVTNPTWAELFKNAMQLDNDHYHLSCVNGSGFASGSPTFLGQLQNLNITDKNLITDILVVGGYNDKVSTYGNIMSAIDAFMTYVKNNYVNARVSIACVGWTVNAINRNPIMLHVIPAYSQCGLYSARYLCNTEYIMHDYDLYANDKFHPNQEGQYQLACHIVTAFLNGSCDVVRSYKENTVPVTDQFIAQNITMVSQVVNGWALWGFSGFGVTFRTPITFDNETDVVIAEFDSCRFAAGNSDHNLMSTYRQVWIKYGNNQFANIDCRITLYWDYEANKTKLIFRPRSHGINNADATHSADVFTNVSIMNLSGITVAIPAINC